MKTIWNTKCTYVNRLTGELLARKDVTEGYYKINLKTEKSSFIIKNKIRYEYKEIEYQCTKTNQGKQLTIEGV